jgi:hypothetical protein
MRRVMIHSSIIPPRNVNTLPGLVLMTDQVYLSSACADWPDAVILKLPPR